MTEYIKDYITNKERERLTFITESFPFLMSLKKLPTVLVELILEYDDPSCTLPIFPYPSSFLFHQKDMTESISVFTDYTLPKGKERSTIQEIDNDDCHYYLIRVAITMNVIEKVNIHRKKKVVPNCIISGKYCFVSNVVLISSDSRLQCKEKVIFFCSDVLTDVFIELHNKEFHPNGYSSCGSIFSDCEQNFFIPEQVTLLHSDSKEMFLARDDPALIRIRIGETHLKYIPSVPTRKFDVWSDDEMYGYDYIPPEEPYVFGDRVCPIVSKNKYSCGRTSEASTSLRSQKYKKDYFQRESERDESTFEYNLYKGR